METCCRTTHQALAHMIRHLGLLYPRVERLWIRGQYTTGYGTDTAFTSKSLNKLKNIKFALPGRAPHEERLTQQNLHALTYKHTTPELKFSSLCSRGDRDQEKREFLIRRQKFQIF